MKNKFIIPAFFALFLSILAAKAQVYSSGDINVDIPGLNSITNVIDVSGATDEIDKVVLTIELEHSCNEGGIGEMDVFLESPQGSISRAAFEYGDVVWGVQSLSCRFKDEASFKISQGSEPYGGDYKPTESFSTSLGTDFKGLDANANGGGWRLRVVNECFRPAALVSWSLEFVGARTLIIESSDFGSPLCAGGDISIDFVAEGFAPGETVEALLSDGDGNFNSSILIGSAAATPSGTISATIPSYVASGSGYRIRLAAGDPQKFSTDNGSDIQIFGEPNPEILSGEIAVCIGKIYEYVSNKSDSESCNWTVSGGEIVGSDNERAVSVIWRAEGIGELSVSTWNLSECAATYSESVEVFSAPTAEIVTNGTDCCVGEEFEVSASSATYYENLWTIENAELLGEPTDPEVSAIWDVSGTWRVSLEQTDIRTGCSKTFAKDIKTYDAPSPEISSGDFNVCGGAVETYTAESRTFSDYQWAVSGGEILGESIGDEIDVKWAVSGTGEITLIETLSEGFCSGTYVEAVEILQGTPFEITGGSEEVCSGESSTYSVDLSDGGSVVWSVSGGEILGASDAADCAVEWISGPSGTVSAIRSDAEGCETESYLEINIIDIPKPAISGLFTVCAGCELEYTASNPQFSSRWRVEGGEIVSGQNSTAARVRWASGSLGKLVLTKFDQSSGCEDSTAITISIVDVPEIEINGSLDVCQNQEINYSTNPNAMFENKWSVVGGDVLGIDDGINCFVRWETEGAGRIKLVQAVPEVGYVDSLALDVSVDKSPPRPTLSETSPGVLESSADEGNRWYKNGALIPGENGKTFSPTSDGLYAVQVENEFGCLSEISAVYQFIISSAYKEFSGNFNVYPNPIYDKAFIALSGSERALKIVLMDLSGRSLLDIDKSLLPGVIDFHHLPQGLYFIVVYRDRDLPLTIPIVKL